MQEFYIHSEEARYDGENLESFTGIATSTDTAALSPTAVEWFKKNIKKDWGYAVMTTKLTFDVTPTASPLGFSDGEIRWWVDGTYIWFDDDNDAMLFKMVWM